MRTVLTLAVAAALLLAACGEAEKAPAPAAFTLGDKEFHASEHLVVAGQPDARRLAELKSAGFTRVVSINPQAKAPDYDEAAAVLAAGMAYESLPLGKQDVLDPAARERAFALLERLEQSGEPVYLHCSSANRCGALWTFYQVERKGLSPAAALEEGKRVGLTKLEPAVRKMLGLGE